MLCTLRLLVDFWETKNPCLSSCALVVCVPIKVTQPRECFNWKNRELSNASESFSYKLLMDAGKLLLIEQCPDPSSRCDHAYACNCRELANRIILNGG